MRCILAIDQGTTGSTVLIVDVTNPSESIVLGRSTVDFKQYYPRTGWVEHDLEEIWQSVVQAAKVAINQASDSHRHFNLKAIKALGLTNQRETLCVFERGTGRPLTRAIVWQCKRSSEIVARLKAQGVTDIFRRKTGLVLDPYFTGTKITWLMEENDQVASMLRSGRAVLGTVDSYLVARLTGGTSFVTEPSNASRTLCYDIHSGQWDEELLDLLKVPSPDVLPKVLESACDFGQTWCLDFLPNGIPITGVLGDQQAALAGQACFTKGEGKCTYGTGAFLLANLGHTPIASQAGMLTTVAWSIGGQRTYAFEGSAFIAGAAIQFLRDQLGMVDHAAESEDFARGEKGAPEVYFVPALAGLGAPYWNPNASGAFLGLTRGTRKGQLIRAVLEGIAFQVADLTEAMARDLGSSLSVLRVDGGAAANNLLMQAQADFGGITVDRPQNLETTAFGAALFAGLGAGIYTSLQDMRSVRKTERLFHPQGLQEVIAAQRAGWKRAIKAVEVFAER